MTGWRTNQLKLNIPAIFLFAVGRSDIQPNFAHRCWTSLLQACANNLNTDVRIGGTRTARQRDAINKPAVDGPRCGTRQLPHGTRRGRPPHRDRRHGRALPHLPPTTLPKVSALNGG